MIGKLREFVTIQTPTESDDGFGGKTVTWGTFAQVWARIDPITASQKWHANQLEHNVSHKVTIRELAGLTSSMRISWESRIFHVRDFRELGERDRWVEIMAEEGVGVAS